MEEAIVLGKLGHYFDAGNGSCSTALVVDTTHEGAGDIGDPVPIVNVAGWHHDAGLFSRTSVTVVAAPTTVDHANSFHLNRDCPWSR